MSGERFQPDPRLTGTYERLAAAQSIDDVVSVLRQCAKPMIGADGIAVVLRDGGCCHYVAEDSIEPLWTGQRFPLEACISGWAMLNDEVAFVQDVRCDPRVPVPAYRNKAICTLLMVPIGSPEPVAALGAYWSTMVHLSAETVACAETLAHQASKAMARIQAGSA